jgi:hypothetical protein
MIMTASGLCICIKALFGIFAGLLTYNNKQAAENDIRCSKASQIIGQISTLISSKEISLEVKRTIYNTIFTPTLCYRCQTWTLDTRTIRKITTTEMNVLGE